jgi:signal peptidase I
MKTESTPMPQRSRLHEWTRSALQMALVLAVISAAKIAIAEPYYVPSGSMEPTLLIGDELLATKYTYGYSSASLPAFMGLPSTPRVFGAMPERGDIVVFRWPGDRSQIWVKRVIGMPGDRIAMRGGLLWINGKPVGIRPDGTGYAELENGSTIPAERFVEMLPGGREHAILKITSDSRLDEMAEITVPPRHLFVMGDNRDNSADSRVPVTSGGVGLLPVGNLVGRVNVLVGSWDLGIKSQPIWTWPAGLRLSRFFTSVH